MTLGFFYFFLFELVNTANVPAKREQKVLYVFRTRFHFFLTLRLFCLTGSDISALQLGKWSFLFRKVLRQTYGKLYRRRRKVQQVICVRMSSYYINTNEIPGELWRENVISTHVKRSPLLWLHNKSRLLQ